MAELHALTVAEHIRVAEAFDTLKGELALICEITRQPLRELGAAIDAAIDPLRREYVDFLHCHDLHSIAAVYYARPDARPVPGITKLRRRMRRSA